MNRIDKLFAAKRAEKKTVLVIFLTAGYPDLPTSVDLAVAALEAGADMIEFGIPFSDPLADGPTIQRSSMLALEHGATLDRVLDATREFRLRSQAPMIYMGAYNPLFHRGTANAVRMCREAGADGFILPDVPPEESAEVEAICEKEDMALVHLVAPTSTLERRRMIAERSRGFIYYISTKGVTGARTSLPENVIEELDALRSLTDKPVAIGFGISRPEDVRTYAPHADGIIVGSAFINVVAQHEGKPELLDEVKKYVASLAVEL